MKIKIPAIDLIFNGHFDEIEKTYLTLFFQTGEKDANYLQVWSDYRKILEGNVHLFANNIIFLSSSFLDMVKKHWDSLLNIYQEEAQKEDSEILDFHGVVFDQQNGCLLEIVNEKISFSIFDRVTGVPFYTGNLNFDSSSRLLIGSHHLFLSKSKDFLEEVMISHVFRFVLSVLLEKLIDGKEVIIVPPNGRVKSQQGKFVNENKSGLKVWDSRKFNSYVRLDGFSVTGHLRHQRVGKGRKGHKLIWINEFQKHGYNRNTLRTNLNGIHKVGIN